MKHLTRIVNFGIYALTVFLFQHAQGQNLQWAKSLNSPTYGAGVAIAVDAAGNVYTTGNFMDTIDMDPGPGVHQLFASNNSKGYISKLDSNGNFVWALQLLWPTSSIDLDPQGNIIVGGSGFFMKVSPGGSTLWISYAGPSASSLATDSIGNIYVTGFFTGTRDFDQGPAHVALTSFGGEDCVVAKYDSSGNLLWAKQIGGSDDDEGTTIALDDAGNVYTAGLFDGTADLDPGSGVYSVSASSTTQFCIFLSKLDAAGNFIWGKIFDAYAADWVHSIAVDLSGNVYTTGRFGTTDFDPGPGTMQVTGYDDAFVCKLDSSGNFVWVKAFGGQNGQDAGLCVVPDATGNVYITGYFHDITDFDPGPATFNLTSFGFLDIFICKLDSAGNLVWAKQCGASDDDRGHSMTIDELNNVYVTGFFMDTADFDPGPQTMLLTAGALNPFVLKLTTNPIYIVQGNIFADINRNCSNDIGDLIFPGVLVTTSPGPIYGLSDIAGNYSLYLPDTGRYALTIASEDPLWYPACDTVHEVHVTTATNMVSQLNLAIQGPDCQRLTVDIGTNLLRPCVPRTCTVQYGNTGARHASNAYIEADFGDHLQPQSSSIPWSAVSGTVYTFPVGGLNALQQGSFSVTVFVNCSTALGSTQCITARIYPDSACTPPPAGWDGSTTNVTGVCDNDSLVCFTIKNLSPAGTGDMAASAQWRLYANDTLVMRGTYQLAGQDSLVKCFPANGKTYRLEADQTAPHPRHSQPRIIIEACGTVPPDLGFVNTVPQDDEELSIETFCTEVVGSFDPNDKNVTPAGTTSGKYITAHAELEYLIRFQNTGTDTAFRVIIRDTIATDLLDLATLVSGPGSHDYTFNIFGQGIAEWTFDNILLPDSNVNEPESHGFVKFKIGQLPGNPDGTRIENSADIYFDHNVPVTTNTAWNVVNEAGMPTSLFSAGIHDSSIIICDGTPGSAAVVVTGGIAPYQYHWNNGATTAAIFNLQQGTYSVTATDAAGTFFTDSVTITQPPPLLTSVSTQNSVSCFGDNDAAVKANVSGGLPPYAFIWSNGETGASSENLFAGNYVVTVTDSNNCSLVTAITIQDGYQINVGSIAGADSANINQTTSYSIAQGLAYAWTVTKGTIVAGQGSHTVQVDWDTMGQGLLQVVVADQGCIDTVSKTITVGNYSAVENFALNAFTIYPNPTTGTLTLKGINSKGAASLRIYNFLGKELLAQTIELDQLREGILISMNEYKPGVFLVEVAADEALKVMKVVKY